MTRHVLERVAHTEAFSGAEPPDRVAMAAAKDWLRAGLPVWMATVLSTYGSAPRPVGSIAAINARGEVAGSVSGGCVEDDLADMIVRDAQVSLFARRVIYGATDDERARLRLPCNGHIELWFEPLRLPDVEAVVRALDAGELVGRSLDLPLGVWSPMAVTAANHTSRLTGHRFEQVLGPSYRLVLVGASEVARYLAPMAIALSFSVEVIDPRDEYLSTWPHAGCRLLRDMPDDVLAVSPPDTRTAVVAVSHDPNIDDLALIEALRAPSLYVGAMGSLRTTAVRRDRLRMFNVAEWQLDRLVGPVGMDIGARTPPEIAVAIAADLVRTLRAGG